MIPVYTPTLIATQTSMAHSGHSRDINAYNSSGASRIHKCRDNQLYRHRLPAPAFQQTSLSRLSIPCWLPRLTKAESTDMLTHQAGRQESNLSLFETFTISSLDNTSTPDYDFSVLSRIMPKELAVNLSERCLESSKLLPNPSPFIRSARFIHDLY